MNSTKHTYSIYKPDRCGYHQDRQQFKKVARFSWWLKFCSTVHYIGAVQYISTVQYIGAVQYISTVQYISAVQYIVLAKWGSVSQPQSTQSAGPVRFLLCCSISIFLLDRLVAGRRFQCSAGHP
jgi:hypothetical protein